MPKLTSTQLKATLLCIVFASNTILGFACAVGVDMALLKHIIHYDDTKEESEFCLHVNAACEKCHYHNEKEPVEEDGCCNSKVVSFEHLDKIISNPVSVDFTVHLYGLPLSLFLNTTIHSGASSSFVNNIFRSFHLPTEDICVSIRSFQI